MRFSTSGRTRIFACLAAISAMAAAHSEETRLNQIQVIGSHNSYHRAPPAAVLDMIGKFRKDAVEAWGYTHPPLTEQLGTYGVRQFELDIHADPDGGLFKSPLAVRMAKLAGNPVPEPAAPGVLEKPGFKILHVPDLDCWSNNPTLVSALEELSSWSIAHPSHLPVMVLIECKEEVNPLLPTKSVPFTRERLLDLEKEILSTIPADRIFKPDDLRKDSPDLPTAVRVHGWPTLASLNGKFLFALDNTGDIRERYLADNKALEGRLLFVSAADEKHPAAAWFKCNDPLKQQDRIRELVKAGFLVRTRADESVASPDMREKAFSSGAQWISTDHFKPDEPAASRVAFENGKLVRSNPLTGKPDIEITP